MSHKMSRFFEVDTPPQNFIKDFPKETFLGISLIKFNDWENLNKMKWGVFYVNLKFIGDFLDKIQWQEKH